MGALEGRKNSSLTISEQNRTYMYICPFTTLIAFKWHLASATTILFRKKIILFYSVSWIFFLLMLKYFSGVRWLISFKNLINCVFNIILCQFFFFHKTWFSIWNQSSNTCTKYMNKILFTRLELEMLVITNQVTKIYVGIWLLLSLEQYQVFNPTKYIVVQ